MYITFRLEDGHWFLPWYPTIIVIKSMSRLRCKSGLTGKPVFRDVGWSMSRTSTNDRSELFSLTMRRRAARECAPGLTHLCLSDWKIYHPFVTTTIGTTFILQGNASPQPPFSVPASLSPELSTAMKRAPRHASPLELSMASVPLLHHTTLREYGRARAGCEARVGLLGSRLAWLLDGRRVVLQSYA